MKFDLKKLAKLTAIGAASLALIVPLSMNSGTVANAAEGPYYDANLDDLVYNGFCNEDGYWIGSKHDKWMYDNDLIDSAGTYSDKYEDIQDYTHTRHVSFMRALKLYDITEKMPDKELEKAAKGKLIESDEDAMDVTDAIIHHKSLNQPNHRASKRHVIKRRDKRTPRKSRKKNVKRGHKTRKSRTRKGKRVARKGIKRNRNHKRTVKARKPKKRRRTAKRQLKPKKPATKQGKRKWITYHLPSKQKGSKQGKQQPRKWITYHFK